MGNYFNGIECWRNLHSLFLRVAGLSVFKRFLGWIFLMCNRGSELLIICFQCLLFKRIVLKISEFEELNIIQECYLLNEDNFEHYILPS